MALYRVAHLLDAFTDNVELLTLLGRYLLRIIQVGELLTSMEQVVQITAYVLIVFHVALAGEGDTGSAPEKLPQAHATAAHCASADQDALHDRPNLFGALLPSLFDIGDAPQL